MNTKRAITPLLVAVLLALETSASAECAWVMWEVNGPPPAGPLIPIFWVPMRSFGTLDACDQFTLITNERAKAESWKTAYVCLPDTVDPRGPKGK